VRAVIATVVALLVAVVAVGGCGSGAQSSPQQLDRNDVPFGLLEAPTTTAPPTTAPIAKYPFLVYFILEDGAVAAVRTASQHPDTTTVGGALLEGPTPDELRVGMHSAIPSRSINRFGTASKHTVTIDLQPSFLDVSGATQKQALTQLVFTMTALRGVTQVRFLLDGKPTTVPRLNGTITSGPVHRADYEVRR
jgi:spore germination protein GerM